MRSSSSKKVKGAAFFPVLEKTQKTHISLGEEKREYASERIKQKSMQKSIQIAFLWCELTLTEKRLRNAVLDFSYKKSFVALLELHKFT